MSMDPVMAELILAEAHAAGRRSREAAQQALAAPVGAFALTFVVATPVVLVVGRDHLLPFFGLAFAAISWFAWTRQVQVARDQGVRASLVPWALVIVTILICASTASRVGADRDWPWLNLAGPFVVNAMTFALLAWWTRCRGLGIAAATMPIISTLAVLWVDGDIAIAVQLAAYALLLGAAWRVDRV